MSITIVATVGSASANSFVTEVEQIAYMAARLNASAWTTFSGSSCIETEKAAMIEATRLLSALTTWNGMRVDTTQALAWPRQWARDPDVTWFGWNYFSTTAIPQRVKDATAELAFQFLNAGTQDIAAADPGQGVVEKTVDALTTRWNWARPQGFLERFPSVSRYIHPLLAVSGNASRLMRA